MKKLAFYSIERSNEISESYIKKLVEKLRKNGAEQCRIYEQELEGEKYFFGFIETEKSFESDWMSARHVYEFAQREGDDFTNLEKRGIIIGVADGKLEEYVRLHDEQPQIIHDLCYQNGLENLQFLHSLLYQVIGIYCNLLSIREKKIRAYMKTRHIKSGCVLLESVRNLFQEKNFGKT